MQTKIQSMIPTKAGWQKVTIFGYCSKSIPGLEIQGLGNIGRNMKEKFVFLCKERKISMPFKKYTLCIDVSEIGSNLEKQSVHFLELPFLLTFFYLGGLLPIRTLSDCFCVGRVDVAGTISEPTIEIEKLLKINSENDKFITSKIFDDRANIRLISSKELLESIPSLRFS